LENFNFTLQEMWNFSKWNWKHEI